MQSRENRSVKQWGRMLVVVLALLVVPRSGRGALVVTDFGNLVENVISAAESIESVAQQGTQLANEAESLSHEVTQIQELVSILKDLQQNSTGGITAAWSEVDDTLGALSRAIRVGDAISYDLGDLSSEFQKRFPGYTAPTDWNQSYRKWSTSSLDTLRGTLLSAGRNVGDAPTVQGALDSLRSANESTNSRLEAIQLGNQLASLEIAEMTKLRQLVAAQITSQNTYAASEEARRAGADAAFSHFIDSGVGRAPSSRAAEGLGVVPRP